MAKQKGYDQELVAIGTILTALDPLKEDQRTFVLRTVAERLGISTGAPGSDINRQSGAPGIGDQHSTGETNADGIGDGSDLGTPKLFLRTKKPLTEVHRIACLAYYLTHARNTPHFKTGDLTALNTESAGAKFSNAAVFVDNATRKSHLLAPASKGKKQITAHGEEIVEALPNQEAVQAAAAGQTKPGRRKTGTRKRTARKKHSS